MTESRDQWREGEQQAQRARARMHFAEGEQCSGCGDAEAAALLSPVRWRSTHARRVPCRVLHLRCTSWMTGCRPTYVVVERCLGWEGLRRRTRAAAAARHRQGVQAGAHPTHPTHPTRSVGKGSLSLFLVLGLSGVSGVLGVKHEFRGGSAPSPPGTTCNDRRAKVGWD